MSNKSMVIQFVFINICKKKRNCLLICWKWMSIAKQIKPKCLNSYGFFNWLGFHRFDLPLQCTEFYCLYMSRGYEFLQISKEFQIPEVWKLSSNYHLSEFGLIFFTDLYLGAIYSSRGHSLWILFATFNEGKERFATMPLKHLGCICMGW